ncbi:hypothetical protein Tco_1166319 [Tanacetum coccineum]
MRTRSSSNLVGESSPNPTTSNPKRRNRRRSKQPFSLEESPVDTMADHIAKLTHAVNQQTSDVTTAMTAILYKFQATDLQAYVKAVELRNELQTSIQASMSNQTNEIKNMMASFFQMNTASSSGSGSLPGNTIANPKGELKAITTRSGLVLDGPFVPMPPLFINPEEDERAEET